MPAEPPATFYEALNTILFLRELVQSLDGNGISVFGHLDRTLWPYYVDDMAHGRLTQDEAKDLLGFFLAFSDTRFGMRESGSHVGTNTTVVIGGCDADGKAVFNDVTRMIIEVYLEAGLIDPKLNARVSSRHPREYLDLLARMVARGANNLCLFNDDVIIAANTKMGKALTDCRLYVGGGCQENVLENTEVNSRATIYLNVPQVLLMGFFREQWSAFADREELAILPYTDGGSFDGLYEAFLRNLEAVANTHVRQRNRTEREGWRYNPCPLHSAAVDDCLDKRLDLMAGGARYNFGSISLTGIATTVDSLYALRQIVFEEKSVSLAELAQILLADFAGEGGLRQRLVRRVPKFGQEDDGIRAFSARVFADCARVTSGMPNSRGGRYEASLFSFRTYAHLGASTGATPDGRRAGQHLSMGMSPSQLALGARSSPGQVLSSLEPLDLTLYPVVAVLDAKLPAKPARYKPEIIVPIIQRFLDSGGSVLQLNCVDHKVLLEAREHPERHPDLVVRVSGYSACFAMLPEEIQDEIVAREQLSI